MARTGGRNSTPEKVSRKNYIRGTTIRKDQRAIMGRGRNGWFAPTGVWIEKLAGVTVVGIRSKRFSGNWPIILTGNDDALLSLLERIVESLKNDEQTQRFAIPSGVPRMTQAQIEDQIRHIRLGDDGEK